MTKLQQEYLDYNKKYFNNRLPDDIKVKWGRSNIYMGLCFDDHIMINRELMKWHSIWRMTLLHEMCHLASEDECSQHGRRWKKQMWRLMRLGAFNKLL